MLQAIIIVLILGLIAFIFEPKIDKDDTGKVRLWYNSDIYLANSSRDFIILW